MRSFFIGLILCLGALSLSAQTLYESDTNVDRYFLAKAGSDFAMNYLSVKRNELTPSYGGISLLAGNDNYLYSFLNLGGTGRVAFVIDKKEVRLNSEGYFAIGKVLTKNETRSSALFSFQPIGKVVIPGDEYYFIQDVNADSRFTGYDKLRDYSPEDQFDVRPRVEDLNVSHIEANSHLSEVSGGKTTEYVADNLKRFYSDTRKDLEMANFLPWAARSKSGGVGETLTVYFLQPEVRLGVLNGYVDVERPRLYKSNNRLKEIKIESADSLEKYSLVVNLEDYVHVKSIELPRPTKALIITVIDVYKGTKYNDLVVSGIVGSNTFWNQGTLPVEPRRDLTK